VKCSRHWRGLTCSCPWFS